MLKGVLEMPVFLKPVSRNVYLAVNQRRMLPCDVCGTGIGLKKIVFIC
jgi:hypothetical protein